MKTYQEILLETAQRVLPILVQEYGSEDAVTYAFETAIIFTKKYKKLVGTKTFSDLINDPGEPK